MTHTFQNLDFQIAKAYQTGMTWKAICAHLHISNSTLHAARKRLRLERPAASRTGVDSSAWKGGVYHDKKRGYVWEHVSLEDPLVSMRSANGRCLQHRLVMARYLGRALAAWEEVHHMNGIRSDNSIENLQLRITRHGSGISVACCDCGSKNVQAVAL